MASTEQIREHFDAIRQMLDSIEAKVDKVEGYWGVRKLTHQQTVLIAKTVLSKLVYINQALTRYFR